MKELQVKCQAVAVGKGIFEMQGIKILITRLSISRAKKINKLNSQTDFKEVSSFCKNGIVLLCQREWAVFHAFIFNMQTKECILHTASSSEALYMEETACMFLFHWEVTVYSEHLTEIFLTCRTFFFTSSEHKSWHLHWAFPRSAWKAAGFLFFLHYCRNAMKMYLLTIRIETAWTSSLFGKGSSNFFSNHFSSSLKWKYSLSLFAAELFVVLFSGLQRGYFFPSRYTSQQNLISSASVEFTLPILIEG